MTDEELLAAFAEADAKAKAAVYPFADGYTHRRLSDAAATLRSECQSRGLDCESVAAPSRVMNPYGH